MQNMMSFFKIIILMTTFLQVVNCYAGQKNEEKVQKICDSLSQRYAPDKRTAIFNIHTETIADQIVLKGITDQSLAKKALIDSLEAINISYTDSIKVLPDASLGDKIWALGNLSASNLRSQPDHAAELVSQALMGMPMKVLEYIDGWYRVQTPDNYIGWVDAGGIARFTTGEMSKWKESDRYFFNQILGSAYELPNNKSAIVTDLVLGDIFVVENEVKGFLKFRIPDGRVGYVKKSDCLSWNEWTSAKPNVQAVLSVAKKLVGSPYMWGGTSCKAVDCSGFTKTSYYSQAIILARDASQQARYGEHPDFSNIGNLQAGDLLFFGRNAQHVTHVGMYLEKGRYIHASGFVRINSIDPNDSIFNLTDRKKLLQSSRILNSLNTEGIVLVKDHPWYSDLK